MQKKHKKQKKSKHLPRVARVRHKGQIMVRAEDGTSYISCKPLPFTPGFEELVPGLKCLVICAQRSTEGGAHNSVRCKIKECYKHVILIGVGKYYRDTHLVSPIYLAKLKRDGTIPNSFYHRLVLGMFSSKRIMPVKLQSYIRKENLMGRGDRPKKGKKKPKRRRTPAERRTKAKAISSKRVKKEKKKRVTITGAIFAYFDKVRAQHGDLKKISYERTLKIAKMVKPTTAFNKGHFSWYRNAYRLARDIDSPTMKASTKKKKKKRAKKRRR